MWILTVRQRRLDAVVVADSGETPVWADLLSAVAAAQRLGLPRCSPRRVQAKGLIDPVAYHEGMSFEACRAETARWR